MKWIPIKDAARRMGMSLDELIERVVDDDSLQELPWAIKCNGWEVIQCAGKRAALLARKPGDPKIESNECGSPRRSLAGHYRMHSGSSKNLALSWPNPGVRTDVLLWTDAFDWVTPDDILLPIETTPCSADEVLIDAEAMGWLADTINTQARETLLTLIGTLTMAAGLDIHGPIDPAAQRIEQWCNQAGAPVSKRTITTRLAEARDLVRKVNLQT
ncbi:MAG: hypothetical protein R3F15_00790 [Lysobacterales bacterium]